MRVAHDGKRWLRGMGCEHCEHREVGVIAREVRGAQL